MMLRLLLLALVVVVAAACSSSSGDDAGVDGRVHDYAKIEGPTTKPVVDLPVTPDLPLADIFAPDAGADAAPAQ